MVQPNSIAQTVFGYEYFGVQPNDLGIFVVPANAGIVHVEDANQSVLSPGGYIVRYSEGEYIIPGQQSAIVGGVNGLSVQWKEADKSNWFSIPFPQVNPSQAKFRSAWNVDEMCFCELVRPGIIQLVPPKSAYGTVRVRILQALLPDA